jgi:ketosteroid isomerase-like protein
LLWAVTSESLGTHQKISKLTNEKREKIMAITADYVRQVFQGLKNGDGAEFFAHVSDDVDWTVEGTHPLAGHYRSKADFIAGTFFKLGKVLPKGAQLQVEHLLVKDDQAVVELRSLATATNGMRFDNRYCWVCTFENNIITRVRAYLDSAMVAQLFEGNPAA